MNNLISYNQSFMKTIKRREYAWNGQESIDEKIKGPSSVVKNDRGQP
ncbi:hypothetical protein [Paenibacillus polymyxa]|nr:hypothetical protein [Paenibacillus polymyxa]WCM62056.1 hypothetical protein OYT09_03540 [Paenibacillus polymyxa]